MKLTFDYSIFLLRERHTTQKKRQTRIETLSAFLTQLSEIVKTQEILILIAR